MSNYLHYLFIIYTSVTRRYLHTCTVTSVRLVT